MSIKKLATFLLLTCYPLMAEMTLDEKIGQLIVVSVYPDQKQLVDEALRQAIGEQEIVVKKEALKRIEGAIGPQAAEDAITKYHAGSILLQGSWNALSQVHKIRCLQKCAKRPLFVMQDLEWGLTMRHAQGIRFPKNMTLGAIQDNQLIYKLAQTIAKQAKLVGVDMNLAPVMDVNSNPKNPVIGDRSFGEDPQDVAAKGTCFIKGLQESGIYACAKHFPGHGDTEIDSHSALPTITTCELLPFKSAIDAKVTGILTAHIVMQKRDTLPASLSPVFTQELLQNELGFTGLIITDDLFMKAISTQWGPKMAAKLAILAGNDLLITKTDVDQYIEGIKELVQEKKITEAEIDRRVQKILRLKQTCTLSDNIDFTALLASQEALDLKKELYRQAVTLPNSVDPEQLFLHSGSTLLVQIGGAANAPFYNSLKSAKEIDITYLSPVATAFERALVLEKMREYDQIVVSFQEMSRSAKENFGMTDSIKNFLTDSTGMPVRYVLFGSPYALQSFKVGEPCLVAYEDDPDAQTAAAEVLLQKMKPTGRLPVLKGVWDR